jgi:indole-3-glycerol phosphate synthase
MEADKTSYSVLTLEQFTTSLEKRMEEAGAALLAVLTPPGSDGPALGGFYHAEQTAARHKILHDQYADALRRLVSALSATQTGLAMITERYRLAGDASDMRIDDLRKALLPVEEALHGGADRA